MSHQAKSAHAGSCLSCIEILFSIFYLKYSGKLPISKFILSKGHASMALYATAHQFQKLPAERIQNYLRDGSLLWGHPSVHEKMDFIHWSTGSLGHGLSAAVGFSYAEKYLNSGKSNSTKELICAVVSDGELDEGSNWEAILFAAHHRLNTLVVIVDYNKIQSFGRCEDVLNLEPLTAKFEAFGWRTERIDGHQISSVLKAIETAHSSSDDKPLCIIADTIKGKGVPDIEDTLESHYKPITDKQLGAFKK